MDTDCLVCGEHGVTPAESQHLPGVTSDCKPWPRSGTIAVCRSCAHVQKIRDAQWRSDASAIYSNYEMYPLSDGVEQGIFEDGARRARSSRLVERLAGVAAVSQTGRLLDIGCGNGAFLRAFGSQYPNWSLAGSEQGTFSRDVVLAIPGVDDFYSEDLADIKTRFDVVTGIHVVEHLTNPVQVFGAVRRLLTDTGILFLQTPCFLDSPFDLMVADHCSHFTLDTLSEMLNRAGFEISARADDWVPKEIGVIARPLAVQTNVVSHGDPTQSRRETEDRLAWLGRVADDAAQLARNSPLGVFGTSIAGTWLAASLGDGAAFFVDEDETRQGKSYLGTPVIGPKDLADGDRVYLAFPPAIAANLSARLKASYPSVSFISPPRPADGTRAPL